MGFAAIAVAAATMAPVASVAPLTTAAAAPIGPCANVTYAGMCDVQRDEPNRPSQQSMGEVVLPDRATLCKPSASQAISR